MDEKAANEVMDHLTGLAVSILDKNTEELKIMKAGLDEYVDAVTSKMTGPAKKVAQDVFGKCRMCAGEWIMVYRDSKFDPGSKADILREEAAEFFFTTDEKIRAVQTKFVLLGMIDRLLKPGKPFTATTREAKTANAKIKIMAREKGLTARCKPAPETGTDRQCSGRLWYFRDHRNLLQSDDTGLTDEEAVAYLLRQQK